MDCIFCSIIEGKTPCMKVYEDEYSLVFMDIAGDVDGHMVAIPKAHCESILDCSEEILASLMKAVQIVARHCTANCGFEGVNLLNASGVSAGQSVSHLHIHIIPRRGDDGVDAWPGFDGAKCSISEMHEILRME